MKFIHPKRVLKTLILLLVNITLPAILYDCFGWQLSKKNYAHIHTFMHMHLCMNRCVLFQWKDAPPEQVMDSKLKCVFELSPDLLQVRFIMSGIKYF